MTDSQSRYLADHMEARNLWHNNYKICWSLLSFLNVVHEHTDATLTTVYGRFKNTCSSAQYICERVPLYLPSAGIKRIPLRKPRSKILKIEPVTSLICLALFFILLKKKQVCREKQTSGRRTLARQSCNCWNKVNVRVQSGLAAFICWICSVRLPKPCSYSVVHTSENTSISDCHHHM